MHTSLTVRAKHLLLLTLPLLAVLSACGRQTMEFRYPGELVDFEYTGTSATSLYIEQIRDLRPAEQRAGDGSVFFIRYPSDRSWRVPLEQTYGDALIQDIEQTQLVDLVPLRRQADFLLTAEILSLTCRLQRSPMSFLLPAVLGMGTGMVTGHDTSDKIKVGLVAGAAAVIAMPMPTRHGAEAEVRLTLRDSNNAIVWSKTCLGEISDKQYMPATSNPGQEHVDKYLARAIKRCNACLLGQLRQALIENAP